MKATYIIVIIAAICVFLFISRTKNVRFNIEVPQIKEGSLFIRNLNDSIVFSSSIVNGKTILNKPMLVQPGYYTIQASPYNGRAGSKNIIYVEPGQYNIKIKGKNYPKITTNSKIQQELSIYNKLLDSIRQAASKRTGKYNRQLQSESAKALSAHAYTELINNINNGDKELSNAANTAFLRYIKRYPNSILAAHLMAGVDYESDPIKYDKIFKSLSDEARNTDEGQEIGKKLSRLVNIVPGHGAPLIIGTTPDGKSFEKNDLNKKLYLLEIWKAGNMLSRTNHHDLANPELMQKIIPDLKDLGMISISLDHNRDWWLNAIQEDKLTWPQYSDLKGNESLNGLNWNVTNLPTYCLLDNQWRVVENDVMWSELPIVINRYLAGH